MSRISIIGAGAWGTALSIVLAGRGYAVRLWVYETDLYQRLLQTRENDVFLPSFRLQRLVFAAGARLVRPFLALGRPRHGGTSPQAAWG